jgi:cell division transport system permease protein
MAILSQRIRRKKRLGSYPYGTVVFSIALALFTIGVFGMLLLQARKLADLIQQSLEVQVYLERELTEPQLIRLQKTIAQKPYIALQDNVPQVRYVSKEEGAQQLIKETGEDFMTFLGNNPLRDVLVINLSADYADRAQLQKVKRDLVKLKGVHEVQYVESLIEAIRKNVKRLSFLLLGFAAVLLTAAVLLINNTIKLAMFSQRFLIRSMQLVGATGGFIQKPFLTRATLQGAAAGVLATLLLLALLQWATYELPELRVLQDPIQLAFLLGALVLLGSLIGLLSAFRAVQKYLHLSLDDLY